MEVVTSLSPREAILSVLADRGRMMTARQVSDALRARGYEWRSGRKLSYTVPTVDRVRPVLLTLETTGDVRRQVMPPVGPYAGQVGWVIA